MFAGQAWAGWALGQGQQPGAPTPALHPFKLTEKRVVAVTAELSLRD